MSAGNRRAVEAAHQPLTTVPRGANEELAHNRNQRAVLDPERRVTAHSGANSSPTWKRKTRREGGAKMRIWTDAPRCLALLPVPLKQLVNYQESFNLQRGQAQPGRTSNNSLRLLYRAMAFAISPRNSS